MNRRALSPLTATLILIGFAILLGSLILNLGSNISVTATQLGECRDFNILQIDTTTGLPNVCFNEYRIMGTSIAEQNIEELNIKYDRQNKYLIQIR